MDGANSNHAAVVRARSPNRRTGGRLSSARQSRQVVERKTVAEKLAGELRDEQRRLNAEQRRLNDATAEMQGRLRIPLRGYGEQLGAAPGYWADGWIGGKFAVTLKPELKVRIVELRLWQPADRWKVQSMLVSVADISQTLALWPGQCARLNMRVALPAQQPFSLEISAQSTWRAPGEDDRELAGQLLGVWLWH